MAVFVLTRRCLPNQCYLVFPLRCSDSLGQHQNDSHISKGLFYKSCMLTSTVLRFLLHTYLRLDKEENAVDRDSEDEDDETTDGEETAIEQSGNTTTTTTTFQDEQKKASANASAAAAWAMLHQGIARIIIHSCTFFLRNIVSSLYKGDLSVVVDAIENFVRQIFFWYLRFRLYWRRP